MDLRVDIIVLGATGFTGKHAVKNLARLSKEGEFSDIRWGIAGRSKEKLNNLLTELEDLGVDIKKVPVLECDITKEGALEEMTMKTRVIVNATGPNTLLSEPVVKACIHTGTHYVDISAELHHMLKIYRTYHKAAELANVLIIPACGFDCVPSSGGLLHLEKQFKGTIKTVECYTTLDMPKKAYFPIGNHCILHYGTWESMIHEMQNFKQYTELKKQTYPNPDPVPGDIQKSFFHRHKGRFWCPYPGADRDVAFMYQQYQKEHTNQYYHFKIYTTMPLFIYFFIIVPAFFLFYLMSHFGWTRNLLWKYPRVFTLGYVSHKGPNEEMRKGLKFSFTLTGKGWSDGANLKDATNKIITVKVSGEDPGYQTTATTLILSAITILKDRSKMPMGGVLMTGSAFKNTSFVDRLIKYNAMKFEVLEDKNIDNGKYVAKL